MTSNELKHQANLREWQEKITDCRSSGLCVQEWCRQSSVAPTTYYRWEQELLRGIKKEEAANRALPVLAELPIPRSSREVPRHTATLKLGNGSIDFYCEMSAEPDAAAVPVDHGGATDRAAEGTPGSRWDEHGLSAKNGAKP